MSGKVGIKVFQGEREMAAELRLKFSPKGLGFRVYLNPEEPTFLGFLIMISLNKSLKR